MPSSLNHIFLGGGKAEKRRGKGGGGVGGGGRVLLLMPKTSKQYNIDEGEAERCKSSHTEGGSCRGGRQGGGWGESDRWLSLTLDDDMPNELG